MTEQSNQPKFTREEYFAMLNREGISDANVREALNAHRTTLGQKAIAKVSEVDLPLDEIMMIVRITPYAHVHTPAQIVSILNRVQLAPDVALGRLTAYCEAVNIQPPTSLILWDRSLIELEGALAMFLTLNNLPISLIRNQMKREYPDAAYGEKRVSGGRNAETVDPKAIRLRLNEVFGQPGIGWRISASQATLAHSEAYTEKVSEENAKKGKIGRDMQQVRVFLACGEYAVRSVLTGGIDYVRTNIIVDGWHSDSFEAAGSGAGTAMMKEFARLLGGMDLSEGEKLTGHDD